MMKVENIDFNIGTICNEDLFICAVGYEKRSFFLLKKFMEKIPKQNILIFCFEEFGKKYPDMYAEVESMPQRRKVSYDSGDKVEKTIVDFLENKEKGTAYIDYSSMPRNWYTCLPITLAKISRIKCIYLYVSGRYPGNYEAFPSAGINSYSSVGTPSARVEKKRLHLIGLGYDVIRTKALISILDPDYFGVCYAHEENDREMIENVRNANNQIISQSVSQIRFYTNDFEFMIAKLSEVVRENLPLGDVILVPDGPKPLIMAMALIPQMLNKEGVICLFVSRNLTNYEPVDVEPTDKVLGFSIYEEGHLVINEIT